VDDRYNNGLSNNYFFLNNNYFFLSNNFNDFFLGNNNYFLRLIVEFLLYFTGLLVFGEALRVLILFVAFANEDG
jgi:hypothetical protein